MDEIDRLAPVEQVDLGAIGPVEGQHMGAHLLRRPGELGQREGELVVGGGDRGDHGAGAQQLQIRQIERTVAGGADHQLGTAQGLRLADETKTVGERLHLTQYVGLYQPKVKVATAQVARDAAPHLAIAKQCRLANVEGSVEIAGQRLG